MSAEPSVPLRVLMVMHMPASTELGGARVQLELADALRESGCHVRVLARDEILDDRKIRQLGVSPDKFAREAVRCVQDLAHDYDIIDAHQGSLPVHKDQLRFCGLLVTRSVGLTPFYAEFARVARRRWPTAERGRVVARPLHRWREWRFVQQSIATYRLCDLINVANVDERAYLQKQFGFGGKTIVLPFGMNERRLAILSSTSKERAKAPNRVAVVGDWSPRKGSQDWPDIVARVQRQVDDASFAFLGTRVGVSAVKHAIEQKVSSSEFDVIPSYPANSLAQLLKDVRVGALPSYIEGFPFAVLEQLISGIPVIAYDVPGPRETLSKIDPKLLVPAGDTARFAECLVELLALRGDRYERLSRQCRAVAEGFTWKSIGAETLAIYRKRLAAVQGNTSHR